MNYYADSFFLLEIMRKKIIIVSFVLMLAFVLSGCKSIFKDNINRFQQVELSKDEIENDVFYVKDGTKFIKTHEAYIKNATTMNDNRSQKICFLRKDFQTVPTLYKGEILAIASEKTSIDNVDLIRFKEIGYTLGFYNMYFDNDSYLCGKMSHCIFEYSDLYDFMEENLISENLRIVSINGIEIDENMVTDTGIFMGLDKDAAYTFDYYAGTRFMNGTAKADVFMMEEFEYYQLTESIDTKNGYISFVMPKDAKTGWYYISNGGLFRYVAEEKGIDINTLDMNEPYYTENIRKEDIYSQKYSVTFDIRLKDVQITLPYDERSIADENLISAVLYSPDETVYDMTIDKNENVINCMLDEAMAGKWTIYIEPKELYLSNIKVLSSKYQQEITQEEFDLLIEEAAPNTEFKVKYEGDGEIYAILVCPDEVTYNMEVDVKKRTLEYVLPYAAAGTYKIKVYHYTDTNISVVEQSAHTITDSEILTITE